MNASASGSPSCEQQLVEQRLGDDEWKEAAASTPGDAEKKMSQRPMDTSEKSEGDPFDLMDIVQMRASSDPDANAKVINDETKKVAAVEAKEPVMAAKGVSKTSVQFFSHRGGGVGGGDGGGPEKTQLRRSPPQSSWPLAVMSGGLTPGAHAVAGTSSGQFVRRPAEGEEENDADGEESADGRSHESKSDAEEESPGELVLEDHNDVEQQQQQQQQQRVQRNSADLVEAQPISEEEERSRLALDVAIPMNNNSSQCDPKQQSSQEKQSNKSWRTWLLLVLAGLELFGGGFAAGKFSERNNTGQTAEVNDTPIHTIPPTPILLATSAPTTMEQILLPLLPEYTQIALSSDPDSPQSRAYRWLLEDPLLDKLPEWRILQRYAMAVFFLATEGPTAWERKDGWMNSTLHECQWIQMGGYDAADMDRHVDIYIDFVIKHHVTGILDMGMFASNNKGGSDCDGKGRLQVLRLSQNGLRGSIPNEIGLLSNLQKLILFANKKIVGTLPTTLGLLTDMRWMEFSYLDQVQGTVPSEVGQLSNLDLISFDFMTNLKGTLPSEVGRFTNLSDFHVRESGLFGPLPTQIGLLSQLRLFDGGDSPLPGTFSKGLFQLSNLRVLQLGSVTGGSLPQGIQNLSNLRIFSFSEGHITGTLPPQMGDHLTKLRYLRLNGNGLSGTLPSQWGTVLSDLQLFQLERNDLSGTIPPQYGLFTNLAELALNGNPRLSGTVPPSVCSAPQKGLHFNCTRMPLLCGCNLCTCS